MSSVAELVRTIYEPLVTSQYPEEVARYGIDAVWDALGKVTRCPECGHDPEED